MSSLNLSTIGLEELDYNEAITVDGGIAPLVIVAVLVVIGLIVSEQPAY